MEGALGKAGAVAAALVACVAVLDRGVTALDGRIGGQVLPVATRVHLVEERRKEEATAVETALAALTDEVHELALEVARHCGRGTE